MLKKLVDFLRRKDLVPEKDWRKIVDDIRNEEEWEE